MHHNTPQRSHSVYAPCQFVFNPMFFIGIGIVLSFLVWIWGPVFAFADDGHYFQRVLPQEYPAFEDDLDYERLSEAIQGSIDYFKKQSHLTPVQFGEDQYAAGHMIRSLTKFRNVISARPAAPQLREFIYQNYYVYTYKISEPDGSDGVSSMFNASRPGVLETFSRPVELLFTGYYEPMLQGSRSQTQDFCYPVYGRPSDLVSFDLGDFSPKCPSEKCIGRYTGLSVVPYYTRQEIETFNVLAGKAPVLVWVDDPVDLFFLHVQGSGKIRLADDTIINVHYLISNGRPYQSIGKYFIEFGLMEKEAVSMQAIRSYLRAHPDESRDILNYNPRYVFFEEVPEGPLGCFQIVLTPGRSIALDKNQYPPAALVFIQTQKPVVTENGKIEKWVKFSRFVLNQDTGSAISGPARADIFWGHGPYAELAAGYMRQPGTLYFLVQKPF